MHQQALTISLLNLAIFVLMSEGYVAHKINIALSNLLDKFFGLKWAAIISEPIYQCYVCMSSFWTVVWWFVLGNPLSWKLPLTMLMVCAISCLLKKTIINERNAD